MHNNKKHDDATVFKQTNDNVHPSTYNTRDWKDLSTEQKTENYCDLINAVERHKCQAYCKRKKRKRTELQQNSENNRNTRQRTETSENNSTSICESNINCRFSYPFNVPMSPTEFFFTHVKIV